MSTANLDTCVLCCHKSKEWAIGSCNHIICLVCSARLRILCKQNECPVCRLLLEQVAVVVTVKPFQDLGFTKWLSKPELGMYFQSKRLQGRFYDITGSSCKLCPDMYPLRTFRKLKDHMKSHSLFFCEICVDGLKLFPMEFKTYTRPELVSHWRQGDKDDSSHKGHPNCKFCDERYLDNDALHKHLRKQHFWCHFCEAEGKQDYYQNCFALRKHFKDGHFLCEEGNCRNELLTSAFSNEIDLKAHRASVHSRAMSKAEAKQARTLPVEFSYSDYHTENTAVKMRGHSAGLPSYSRGFRDQSGPDVQGPGDKISRVGPGDRVSRASKMRAREEREKAAAIIESKTTSSARTSERAEVVHNSSPKGRRKKVCAQSRANENQTSQDPAASLPPPGFEKKSDTITKEVTPSLSNEENKASEDLLNESWPELVGVATGNSPVRYTPTVPPPPGLGKKQPKEGRLEKKEPREESDCYSKKVVQKKPVETVKEKTTNMEPPPRKIVLTASKVSDKMLSSNNPSLSTSTSSGSRFFEEIKRALGYDKEKFKQFQSFSGWYRSGGLSVNQYSDQCEELFEGQWAVVGPQLAKVMPPGEPRDHLISHFSSKPPSNGLKGSKVKGSKRNKSSKKDNGGGAWVTVEDTGKTRPLPGGRRTVYSEDEYPSLATSAKLPGQPKVPLTNSAWNVQVQT